MFRALRRCSIPRDQVFAVTVGANSKKTLATYHLLEPKDVIASIELLNKVTVGKSRREVGFAQ